MLIENLPEHLKRDYSEAELEDMLADPNLDGEDREWLELLQENM
jgi:hypothetical protein